jgi:hypothetical protein
MAGAFKRLNRRKRVLFSGPLAQFYAVDFGVVTNVDGERWMDVEVSDGSGVAVLRPQFLKLDG